MTPRQAETRGKRLYNPNRKGSTKIYFKCVCFGAKNFGTVFHICSSHASRREVRPFRRLESRRGLPNRLCRERYSFAECTIEENSTVTSFLNQRAERHASHNRQKTNERKSQLPIWVKLGSCSARPSHTIIG